MSPKRDAGKDAPEGGVVELEREFDEAALETELRESGQKPQSLASNGKPINRFEFVRAAQNFKPKIAVVTLPTPLEGRQIKVRELTAGERDKYEGSLVRGRMGNQRLNMEELRVGLIVAAAVEWEDETTPLFAEKDKSELRKMGISVISVIYDAAAELSKVSKDDEDELMGE